MNKIKIYGMKFSKKKTIKGNIKKKNFSMTMVLHGIFVKIRSLKSNFLNVFITGHHVLIKWLTAKV